MKTISIDKLGITIGIDDETGEVVVPGSRYRPSDLRSIASIADKELRRAMAERELDRRETHHHGRKRRH